MLRICRSALFVLALMPVLAASSVCAASEAAAGSLPAAPRVSEAAPVGAQRGIAGTVIDPSGATVANATVHIETTQRPGVHVATPVSRDVTTDGSGHFAASLPTGTYDITIVAPGFDPYIATVTINQMKPNVTLKASLAIASAATTITVGAETEQASTASDDNKSALVFNKKTLDSFSNDDDTFQQQLLALAGGGDPQNPPQIYVDGFSNGQFPPKSEIREIRINQNPYSAQYDALGYGRVEIFTKPGANTYHGSFYTQGNDSAFNASNPYVGSEPAYHLLNFDGNFSGPLGKKTSFFLGSNVRDQQNNAAVNATTGLDANGNPVQTIEATPDPVTVQWYSARVDRQVTTNNTLTGRYSFYRQKQTNSGVGLLTLPSAGVDTLTDNHHIQIRDTQVIGSNTIAETRFQYVHSTTTQAALSGNASIIVEGAFNGGASSTQSSSDVQNNYELQEYISHQAGPHFLRMGGRYRATRETNSSTANFNGTFLFPSIQAYLANQPTQFSVNTGTPTATILVQDVSLYAEDEWKMRPDLTVNLGARFESQTSIHDHADPSPHVGVAWAIGQTDKHTAYAVVRGGGAIYYDRFGAGNLITTLHQNGTAQQTFIVENPTFFCTTLGSSCPPAGSLTAQTPSIYEVAPNLRAQYSVVSGVSVDRDLWKKGTLSVGYIYQRGVHDYNSANVNAPLPGTYDPAVAGSGVRPMGGTQNVYQYQSNGISNSNRLFAHLQLNPSRRFFVWAYAVAREQRSDTSGSGSFASNSYNLAQDYGRPSYPGKRVYTGAHYEFDRTPVLHGFMVDYFLGAYGGTPFNITTGTDLNGDTQYNDRPAFATDLTRASVVRTKYGNFDTAPIAGQTIIPINYGTGPAFVDLDMTAGKVFRWGPRTPEDGGMPGPPNPKDLPDPRYQLELTVEAENVLNHPNAGTPVGVLTSSFFGQSLSLNSPFSSNTAANRLVTLRASFSF